jgi:SH3-like domain-containing protein
MASRLLWTGVAALLVASLGAAPRPARATDYKSIGPDPAILYDAPTTRGRKLFVAPRGMPVEVVVAQSDWIRVRDQSGDLSWVEWKALVDKRTVIATAGAAAHAGPDETTPVVFRVQQGVVLDLLEAPSNGYAHVRHRDGASGWLRLTDLWGT